jgi:hypothetical protein
MVIKQSKATPWVNGTKQHNANSVPYGGSAQQQREGMSKWSLIGVFIEQPFSCILVMEFGGLPSLLTVCLKHFFSTNII